jgi:hypothetical protein
MISTKTFQAVWAKASSRFQQSGPVRPKDFINYCCSVGVKYSSSVCGQVFNLTIQSMMRMGKAHLIGKALYEIEEDNSMVDWRYENKHQEPPKPVAVEGSIFYEPPDSRELVRLELKKLPGTPSVAAIQQICFDHGVTPLSFIKYMEARKLKRLGKLPNTVERSLVVDMHGSKTKKTITRTISL